MALEIVFTDRAYATLFSIAETIEEKWGLTSAKKFINKTYKIIDLIALYPLIFEATPFNNQVRKAIVSSHTSFSYDVKEKKS